MSSANTPKIRVSYFKLFLKIGDPGESGAKQEVWYYSDVRAILAYYDVRVILYKNIFYKITFGTLT